MNLLSYWVDYKYHTALSILSLFFYTGGMFGVWNFSLACLLFFCTHLFYLWGSGRMLLLISRSFGFGLLLLGEILVVIYLLMQIEWFELLNFMFLGVAALCYYKPIFGIRFRYVTGLKVFWVGLLWVGVLFQMFFLSIPAEFSIPLWQLLLHFISIYFLIAAITIPFDIRDLDSDSFSLKTLPQLFGLSYAKGIAVLFLLISELLRCYITLNFRGLFFYTLTITFVMYAFLMIYFSGTQRSGRYYSFGVEFVPVVLSINFFLTDYLLSI